MDAKGGGVATCLICIKSIQVLHVFKSIHCCCAVCKGYQLLIAGRKQKSCFWKGRSASWGYQICMKLNFCDTSSLLKQIRILPVLLSHLCFKLGLGSRMGTASRGVHLAWLEIPVWRLKVLPAALCCSSLVGLSYGQFLFCCMLGKRLAMPLCWTGCWEESDKCWCWRGCV